MRQYEWVSDVTKSHHILKFFLAEVADDGSVDFLRHFYASVDEFLHLIAALDSVPEVNEAMFHQVGHVESIGDLDERRQLLRFEPGCDWVGVDEFEPQVEIGDGEIDENVCLFDCQWQFR